MEHLIIQSLGSRTQFQEDIKIPAAKQLIIQSLGLLIGFEEDIKIPRSHGTINHTLIRVPDRVSRRYQNYPAP